MTLRSSRRMGRILANRLAAERHEVMNTECESRLQPERRAHEYWRLKQLAVDLVIVNERAASYIQDLQIALDALVRMNQSMPRLASDDARGAVFALRADLVPAGSACPASGGRPRRAARQSRLAGRADQPRPRLRARQRAAAAARAAGRGAGSAPGAAGDGILQRARRIRRTTAANTDHSRRRSERTPAPWINVIANPAFGFQVSTDGSGYTWSVNSRENQLTPWSNDPVGDAPGEVHLCARRGYRRGLGTHRAAHPRRRRRPISARHGQGYSRFEHASHGISLELLQYRAARAIRSRFRG